MAHLFSLIRPRAILFLSMPWDANDANIMATRTASRGLSNSLISLNPSIQQNTLRSWQRSLHITPIRRTDGVYGDLTNMRVKTPWIVALQRQGQTESKSKETIASSASVAELQPKTMHDSLHKVVCRSIPSRPTPAD